MVVGKRSLKRGQRYSRDFGSSEREGASGVVHAEAPPAHDNVKVEERGGEIENWSRCTFALQNAKYAP